MKRQRAEVEAGLLKQAQVLYDELLDRDEQSGAGFMPAPRLSGVDQ